jgi:hypothetical protein
MFGQAMLDESSDPTRPAAAGIEDQPAFTMSQTMLDRIEIHAHPL